MGTGLLAVSLSSLSATAVQAQDKLEFSANVGITSDYVFRGESQSSEHAAGQGGVDASYGIFYAGIWGSSVDFGDNSADVEVDFYAGIKPKLGNFEFDLGVIYYAYPGAKDSAAEYNLVEGKFGVSTSIDKLSLGATLYYSPDYFGSFGKALTVEGTAEYALPMDFALSGTYGQIDFETGTGNRLCLLECRPVKKLWRELVC